jgi:hypothetical protein|uniref:DUF4398 domain-containing protein n=1 Tax=Desulfobacca acetoxidans TaxID=60893 RepID=A0A7C5ERU0_9BACT
MTGSKKYACMLFVLPGLLLSGPTSGRSAPDGEAPAAPAKAPVSDAALFAQELHAAGALKFYENTEALLRAGHFEQALLRYGFLNGQISGYPGYQPLEILINQRLDFLKAQLKVPVTDFLSPPRTRKKPLRAAPKAAASAPAAPSPRNQPAAEAKESEPGRSSTTGDSSEGRVAPGEQASPPPPSPDNRQKSDVSQVQDDKGPEEPPKAPSRWQRLKQRLRFWQMKKKDS